MIVTASPIGSTDEPGLPDESPKPVLIDGLFEEDCMSMIDRFPALEVTYSELRRRLYVTFTVKMRERVDDPDALSYDVRIAQTRDPTKLTYESTSRVNPEETDRDGVIDLLKQDLTGIHAFLRHNRLP
jgi:hypothetical protein